MWSRYPKIAETMKPAARTSGEWVATEKIHGANVSLLITPGQFQLAKRKAILHPAAMDAFFGITQLYPRLHTAAQLVYARMSADVTGIVIYGELYGGYWPDNHGNPVKEAYGVQTGVYYSQSLQYAAFDILAHTRAGSYWLGFDEFQAACDDVLDTVPIVARGSYPQMMQIDRHFTSLMNPAAPPPNIAEGLVLKPTKQYDLNRPMIKRKDPLFQETSTGQPPMLFHSELPPLIVTAASDALTLNRINAAYSKLGQTDSAELITEVTDDILAELPAITQAQEIILRDILAEAIAPMLP